MDLFKKFIQHLEQVLKDARLRKNQIDEIIFIGGSSRIPKIQTMIDEFFSGKKLNKTLNQKLSVAYGAPIQVAIMTNVRAEKIKRFILLDGTPFSLGIETDGETMTILIPKNSFISCKAQIFPTCEDFQKNIIINIFEGENQLTKSNNFLGKFVLEDIQLMPKGKAEIEVYFDIDAKLNF